VFERSAEPLITRGSNRVDARRDWIDTAVPHGSSVALVPSPLDTPSYWWEAEFWNKDVDRVLRVDDGPTFTPFPADDVSVDLASGRLNGAQPADFLVLSPTETRFHLVQGAARVASASPLRLVRVARPYSLVWATRGVTADGWTTPDDEAVLRVYGNGRRGRRTIVLSLSAPAEAVEPIAFTLALKGSLRRASVDSATARTVRLAVCIPAGGHRDVVLTPSGGVLVPDGRVLALHLDQIRAQIAGSCGSG
jgi:hypothetical protein